MQSRFAWQIIFPALLLCASCNSLPAGDVPVGGGLYDFSDPAAVNHRQRFYQLRSQ